MLLEARLLVGESPEQVGGSVRVAGKTIRRLERGEIKRPRELTLTVLARYYALNVAFVLWLSQQDSAGEVFHAALRDWATARGVNAVDLDDGELALRLARQREPAGQSREHDAAFELESDFARLNERRRRMLQQFARELRLAQSEETRRRGAAA